MRVLVYTANYFGWDHPHPHVEQSDVDCDWLYVTDPDGPDPVSGWDWQRAEPEHPESGNLSSKWWRTHPPMDGYDRAVWVDASMEIDSPGFVAGVLAAEQDGLAAWAHPRRDCIYEEARATLGYERQGDKYDDARLLGQVAAYEAEGHPVHGGLYACGTVVWTATAADEFGSMWYAECERWTPQDQISFPVVARRLGVVPGVFDVPQLEPMWRKMRHGVAGNRWLSIHDHAGQDYRELLRRRWKP